MLAADAANVAVYLVGGVLCAVFLLVGRRLIRANKADTEAIVRGEVDKLRGEMNTRLNGMHEDMRDRMDAAEHEVAALATKLAAETGGNSHGLRQAVNDIGAQVAKLQGSFEQYVTDHAKL